MRSSEIPRPRQGTPEGPPEAPPPRPRPLSHPEAGQRATGSLPWSNTASRTPSPLHERPKATCHVITEGTRHDRGWRPAQSRESEPREWFSDRAHASPPRSTTREPLPLAEKVSSRHYQTVFFKSKHSNYFHHGFFMVPLVASTFAVDMTKDSPSGPPRLSSQ
jgi:hypothetical protein